MKKAEKTFIRIIIAALIIVVLALGYGIIQEVLLGDYFAAMILTIITLLLSRLTTLIQVWTKAK